MISPKKARYSTALAAATAQRYERVPVADMNGNYRIDQTPQTPTGE